MHPTDNAARTFRHSVREARWVALLWFLNLSWTIGYSYIHGYPHTADSFVVKLGLADVWEPSQFRHTFGIPNWVLFAVIIPWFVMVTISILFAKFYMSNDDLGVEAEEHHGD